MPSGLGMKGTGSVSARPFRENLGLPPDPEQRIRHTKPSGRTSFIICTRRHSASMDDTRR